MLHSGPRRGECTAPRGRFIPVVPGAENLSPVQPYEADGLAQVAAPGRQAGEPVRLASQAPVRGDVVVFKRGVRPALTDG